MNRLLGIKKRCVAGLAALFVIMITMVSVNASYEWCELMLDDAGVITEEEGGRDRKQAFGNFGKIPNGGCDKDRAISVG